MNNINGTIDTSEQFNLAEFEVGEGYFEAQMGAYEAKYSKEFPLGWVEFFTKYISGQTDKANIDYDEWAFLCDQFMFESWTPPGSSFDDCREKPEATSGLSLSGERICSTQLCILPMSTDCLETVPPGLRL